MKDTIRTLHPEKKQGVNISREKYEIIREAILSALHKQNEITFMKSFACRRKGGQWELRRLGDLVCHNREAGPGGKRPDQARSEFEAAAGEAGILGMIVL